jgi:hypothetical protein
VAKATRAAFRIGELIYQLEANPHHWHQHKLGDALSNLDSERSGPAIPARDQELPLIVRVNETHQVSEDDAVPVAEPGAWEYERGKTGVANVHRQAGGDQLGRAGGEVEGLRQHGTQVETRGTFGDIAWQGEFAPEAGVEDFNLKWTQGSARR